MGTCRCTGRACWRAGRGGPPPLHPLALAKLPGTPGASTRTLESRRSALPAPRPPLLAGWSRLAPSRFHEGMRQQRDARLPGSAARASDSGECGARRGMGVPGAAAGRGFLRVLWSPIHFSKLPERNFPRGVWRTLPFPTSCFPRAKRQCRCKSPAAPASAAD